MPPSRPPPSFPPMYHHKTVPLAPSNAQTLLASYIKSSERQPFLHPTSLLSSTGITHGPNSGPSGGLAMHHLRRIGAGLRGESLTAESREELQARFGDAEVDGTRSGVPAAAPSGAVEELPDGDDAMLDAAIVAGVEGKAEKKQKQELRNGKEKSGSKRKRSEEEISAWAEESSRAGSPAGQEEDLEEFERTREPEEGEVGARDGAPVVRQNGPLPTVVKHDEQGAVEVPRKKPKTAQDKAERKAAKKERKKAESRVRQKEVAAS